MSAIGQVSGVSGFSTTNPYIEMSYAAFYAKFSGKQAKLIGTDDSKYSTEKPITSFSMGDCITLFAIEKREGKSEAIMGWHISNLTTVEELKGDEYLDAYIDGQESEEPGDFSHDLHYDLYIVGGNENTTQGEDCLLNNIRTAINEFFFEGTFTIKQELVHLNAGTAYEYISANLQMDGTLTICRHSS